MMIDLQHRYLSSSLDLVGWTLAMAFLLGLLVTLGQVISFFTGEPDMQSFQYALKPVLLVLLLPAFGLVLGEFTKWRFADQDDERYLIGLLACSQIIALVLAAPATSMTLARLAAI